MRGRVTHRQRKTERRGPAIKPSRMAKGKIDRLAKLLEEWLAESHIRYTHAGD